jgi:hypothetical protein
MDIALYQAAREQMLSDPQWAGQIEWSESVQRPRTPEDMARELIFVIANSGMKNTVARTIYRRVMDALEAGQHPSTVFGHIGKAAAMAMIWQDRKRLFDELAALADEDIVDWCGKLPHIGKITRHHAAKNLGVDTAKPDRWVERVAALSNETVPHLCERIARVTGDRVATVDLVIWWAMAYRVLVIDNGVLRR